jgi:uncharacterized membrane protein YeiH
MLGTLTGIGGGMVRADLVRDIPTLLRAAPYAVAALIGAAVVAVGTMRQLLRRADPAASDGATSGYVSS